jgi:beta-glucosidase
VTFDGTPALVHALAAATDTDATVTVRLDDPLTGPIVATLSIPPTAGPLAEVTAPVSPPAGTHAVFVLFDRPATTVATLSFKP